MKRGAFYDISFFVILVYVFIHKWFEDDRVQKIAFVALAVSVLYEIFYILFFRRREMVSFGRSVAVAGLYISIIHIIMALVYLAFQYMGGTGVAGIFSFDGFCEFYQIPMASNMPYLGIIPMLISLLYIAIYAFVTKRQYLKSAF